MSRLLKIKVLPTFGYFFQHNWLNCGVVYPVAKFDCEGSGALPVIPGKVTESIDSGFQIKCGLFCLFLPHFGDISSKVADF